MTAITIASSRNWMITWDLVAPNVFLTPTSFALSMDRATERLAYIKGSRDNDYKGQSSHAQNELFGKKDTYFIAQEWTRDNFVKRLEIER